MVQRFDFCPFRGVEMRQVNRTVKGGQENLDYSTTLLGLWNSFLSEANAEKVRKSSAILGETTGAMMLYSNGDECWNGPKRLVCIGKSLYLTS